MSIVFICKVMSKYNFRLHSHEDFFIIFNYFAVSTVFDSGRSVVKHNKSTVFANESSFFLFETTNIHHFFIGVISINVLTMVLMPSIANKTMVPAQLK